MEEKDNDLTIENVVEDNDSSSVESSLDNNASNAVETSNSSVSDDSIKSNKIPLTVRIKNFFKPEGIQLEMLRYKSNKISFKFAALGIVLLAAGFCTFYSSTEISSSSGNFNLFGSDQPGYFLGIDIVINILLMLFMVFAAVRMKAYSISQGICNTCFGAFQIIRVFLLPLSLRTAEIMTPLIYTLVTAFYISSGVCSILAGLIAIYRGSALQKYLKSLDIEQGK